MKRKLVRLIPAALSFGSTLVVIESLGREKYGTMAMLLAAVNVLNCCFFHLSRNLIVYTGSLGITAQGIGGLWWLGVAASLMTIIAVANLGWLDAAQAAIVFAFVFNQSLYERRLEIFRSGLLLRHYMQMACVRPVLNLTGLALLVWLFEGGVSPLAFLCVLAFSPLLACFLKHASGGGWPTWCVPTWRATKLLLPKAVMVTIAVSYLFMVDAALKYVSGVVLPGDSFGEYAVISDLLTPGLWVLFSVLAWDFVPKFMRMDRAGKVRLFAQGTLLMMVLLIVILLIAVFVIPDVLWQGKYISAQRWSPLIAAVFLSVYLSTMAFPVLIISGRLMTSVLLSLGGIGATLFVSGIWQVLGLGGRFLLSPPSLLLWTNALIALLVIAVFFKDEIYGSRSRKGKVRSIC